MMPLQAERKIPNPFQGQSNRGLLWNKFVSTWPSLAGDSLRTFKSLRGESKTSWIKKFTSFRGERKPLERAARRLRILAERLGGQAVAFQSTAPFVTGMGLEHPVENGFLWHHTLSAPFLPGSSVKGLIRAWAQQWEGLGEDDEDIVRILGPHMDHAEHGNAGALIFFDALPCEPPELMTEVLTPHDGGWRNDESKIPADWNSPIPIPWLAVRDALLLFAIAPRPGAHEDGAQAVADVEKVFAWLKEALEWTGAGARTAVGLGRFADAEELEKTKRQQAKKTA